MIEHSDSTRMGLSPAGEERKTRMLLELRGAMQRRTARRRVMKRAGSAAAFLLAVGAVWGAVMMQRTGPIHRPPVSASGPVAAGGSTSENAAAPKETVTRLTNVSLMVVSEGTPASATVMGTDAARMERYVAGPSEKSSVQVVSDGQLMRALALTGNEYGLVRVGERVEVECYSCDDGGAVKPVDLPADR